jgi:branched-chain amino acid transport system permease protein
MMKKIIKLIILLIALVFLALYPRLFGIYFTNVFVVFGIYALFSVSLNLLLGFTGLLSFGHAMYFGMGGYATALALQHIEGLSIFPAFLIGFLAALMLALVLAPLMVRVSGTAFAMLHLAFGLLAYILALKMRFITGGEDGIGGFPIPPFSIPGIVSIEMEDPLKFFYFAVIILGVSIWILWFLTKTPFGQIMVAIRDKADRVDYLGYRVPHSKAVVYLFAGSFAGISGSIYALFQNLISPDGALYILNSFIPVMMTMVGGIGSFFGPIYGSAIFGIMDELTSRYLAEQTELVVGLMLILVIMFYPMGFAGFLSFLKGKWLQFRLSRQGQSKKEVVS